MIEQTLSGGAVCAACLAAVPDVLETMFFESIVEPPKAETPTYAALLDVSTVHFDGSASGYLILAAPRQLTTSLAGGFLASEDQSSPQEDAALVLGELANMVCGSVLGRYSPEGTFRLSTPCVQLGQSPNAEGATGVQWLKFCLDSGSLFAGFHLERAE